MIELGNMWQFSSNIYVISSTVLIIICSVLYMYFTRNNNFFAKRNVPYIKPTIFFGNFWPIIMKKTSLTHQLINNYKALDGHRIGGIFQFSECMYILRDPELVKHVTVKDFEHFVDLPIVIPEDVEPILTKNLQALRGQKWKDMRSTLSPAFTSSKMKMIFVLISEIGQQLTEYLEKQLVERQSSFKSELNKQDDPKDVMPIELKELFTKYTNDVIATSAFGVKLNSLQDPDNEFYKMGKEFTNFNFKKIVIVVAYTIFPRVMKALGIRLIPKSQSDFFRKLVRDSIQFREANGIIRPDMIHLLMQVRDDDLFEDTKSPTKKLDDQTPKENSENTKMSLGIDDIAAQALVFFSAGFDVVSTLLSFSSLMLAIHQDVQQRVRDEIDEVLGKHEGKITFEAVHSMKYLDNVISETLRLYPPAAAFSRKCVKNYKVPESDLVLEKDVSVIVPVSGFHYDPQYFPDPEKFNPDRFNEENKHNIKPFTYMPFGSGPRQCIANRFALMETKSALVHLLSKFQLLPSVKTKIPVELSKGILLKVEGGFWITFKLRS